MMAQKLNRGSADTEKIQNGVNNPVKSRRTRAQLTGDDFFGRQAKVNAEIILASKSSKESAAQDAKTNVEKQELPLNCEVATEGMRTFKSQDP